MIQGTFASGALTLKVPAVSETSTPILSPMQRADVKVGDLIPGLDVDVGPALTSLIQTHDVPGVGHAAVRHQSRQWKDAPPKATLTVLGDVLVGYLPTVLDLEVSYLLLTSTRPDALDLKGIDLQEPNHVVDLVLGVSQLALAPQELDHVGLTGLPVQVLGLVLDVIHHGLTMGTRGKVA